MNFDLVDHVWFMFHARMRFFFMSKSKMILRVIEMSWPSSSRPFVNIGAYELCSKYKIDMLHI